MFDETLRTSLTATYSVAISYALLYNNKAHKLLSTVLYKLLKLVDGEHTEQGGRLLNDHVSFRQRKTKALGEKTQATNVSLFSCHSPTLSHHVSRIRPLLIRHSLTLRASYLRFLTQVDTQRLPGIPCRRRTRAMARGGCQPRSLLAPRASWQSTHVWPRRLRQQAMPEESERALVEERG